MIRVAFVSRLGLLAALMASEAGYAQTPGVPADQPPAPVERVSFDEAVQRAIERNPSTVIAAAGILRAEALLLQVQADTRPQINANLTTTTVNRSIEFEGTTVSPRNSVTATGDIRMALYAPARWARRAQAQDARNVAELSAADVRRQIALAAAGAYLEVIARRRTIDVNERARVTAQAHYDLAIELERAGTGSRLNQLRAQVELSLAETLIEGSRLLLYRAQEALGVLMVADGPVDATDEPTFEIPDAATGGIGAPPSADPAASPLFARTDIKLFTAEVQLAERRLRDARKDWYPFLEGVFQPQSTYPGQFFTPNNSWRVLLQLNVPVFDSGRRRGQRREQEAALNISKATLSSAMTTASSEVRAARAAIEAAERALVSARAAGEQAQEVVNIVNISFRAGGATNIEVIDADRRARDAENGVAVAEDTLRRARLDLLTALGRFPR
jgi:outer membrane protein TolC